MGFVFSGLFWGGLVILIGVGIIINVFFDIKIPFGRIILAMVFVGIGISILIKGFETRQGKDVLFSSHRTSFNQEVNEYNIIFGKNVIDFTDANEFEENKEVALNCVFGDGDIKIDDNVPMKIQLSSAFAGAFTPDGNSISFGEYTYTTSAYEKGKPYISLKANVVFGALHIYSKDEILSKAGE